MASKQWNESAETLNGHFNLPPLTTRRTYLKSLYLYKLVNGYVFCPPGLLTPMLESPIQISLYSPLPGHLPFIAHFLSALYKSMELFT